MYDASKIFFNIFTSITIFAFVPLLSVAGCIPPDKRITDTASAAQVEVQDAVVGRVDVGFDASAKFCSTRTNLVPRDGSPRRPILISESLLSVP